MPKTIDLEEMVAPSAQPGGYWVISGQDIYELLWEAYRGKSPDDIYRDAQKNSSRTNVVLTNPDDAEDSIEPAFTED